MPIGNITQTVSTIPAPPHRGVDVQTVFVNKQEDFQDHLAETTIDELNTLKDQLNTRIGEINSTATTMNGYATSASSSASTATTKAGEASTSASEALTSKNQASTFASDSLYFETRASKWADANYNVVVEGGKYSAKHWATVAQNTVSSKVDKVTSTDNAVVRFNGNTGEVQNSGVTIDDNNNVGIANPNPTTKLDVNGSIKTACASTDAVNTRGIIWAIDGNIHGRLAVDNTDNLLYIGNGALGYGTGSGGTVTQLTNKSTTVTLNKPSGQIIMNNDALAAGTSVSFQLNNSIIGYADTIYVTGDNSNYKYEVFGARYGNQIIKVTNVTVSNLSEAPTITFTVIKGANS